MLEQDRGFGIEIEMIIPGGDRHGVANALSVAGIDCSVEGYNHSLRSHWKLTTDVSLSRNGYELVSPILRGDDGLEQIRTVCKVLNEFGCTVNRSCGLHVHHDMNNAQFHEWKNAAILYVKYEEQIDKLMAPSRRGNGAQYVRSTHRGNKDWMFEQLTRATTLSDVRRVFNNDRYHKLNVTDGNYHGTIEFRHHGGTIDGDKIAAWVSLTAGIMSSARAAKFIKPVGADKFENLMKLTADKAARRFLRKRAKAFGQEI